MSVLAVEEGILKEFTNVLANPDLVVILDLSPLHGTVLLGISPYLDLAMIDRMLGGEGLPFKRVGQFIELEILLLERIFGQLIEHLIKHLASIIKTDKSPGYKDRDRFSTSTNNGSVRKNNDCYHEMENWIFGWIY